MNDILERYIYLKVKEAISDINTVDAVVDRIDVDTSKIDDVAVSGLNGTMNSLSYKVGEIEKHLHSAGSWYGQAITPDGEVHVADRIGAGVQPFQLDGGNEDWGSWVQILGSDDTPARANQVYFDPHEIVITASEKAGTYFIQFARGDSGDAGFTAGTYTEVVYESTAVGAKEGGFTTLNTGRAPAGSKLWARTLCLGENTATIDFYMGIHEYEG